MVDQFGTYRLQLTLEFDFRAAAGVVDYLPLCSKRHREPPAAT
ncbi:MAG: hypothetical protein ACREOD_05570 [Candidatus Dormibacteria bacterium]